MQDKPLIEPERAGLWAVAAFVLALIALVVAFVEMFRNEQWLATTQGEILILNKKIEDVRKVISAPAAPAVSAAPAEQK